MGGSQTRLRLLHAALSRPARVPIHSHGCWDTPLAFGVRHRGRELLFSREEDEQGSLSSDYTVREQLDAAGPNPAPPTLEWALRGRTPVGALRFEHHERVSYVTRRSLEQALASAGIVAEVQRGASTAR